MVLYLCLLFWLQFALTEGSDNRTGEYCQTCTVRFGNCQSSNVLCPCIDEWRTCLTEGNCNLGSWVSWCLPLQVIDECHAECSRYSGSSLNSINFLLSFLFVWNLIVWSD
eukprot:TRINITY_DN1871_c0_g2_i1.p1 TRINITY_DN1871_c0_g2~~TRINITY_DN1871_c0_g2_i1.p1  ORF type:complete len:110 (-),score=9.77 TRINITY_DN1871_c0_g2_i1:56-385(-)